MDLVRFIVAPFIALYGLLALLAGPQQWRRQKLSTAAANALMLAGLILLVASYLVWSRSPWALGVLAAGLLSMHVLTAMNQRRNHPQASVWPAQARRLLLSAGFLLLVYLTLA
ncbi:MAG: hypothetical protein KF828_08600 [Anaerolineales bacterium]|nr:hypothetical protein [Anaerolineales bacterium]